MESSYELQRIDWDIRSLTAALSQTPDEHPNMPLLLACIGRAHAKRFDLLNELKDLEKSIEYKFITLNLTPDHNPELLELLFTLAVVHFQRFQRLGDLYDIEKAIEYGHKSVDLTPDGHLALPSLHSNLGMYHRNRFENLGEQIDLEDAIQHTSRAFSLAPDDYPHLPNIIDDLAACHRIRFERLGGLSDIEQAIEYSSCSLALVVEGHPDLPGILTNLGTAHKVRFDHLGELSDLTNAIEYATRAVALTPDGHPDLPLLLTNLGVSHKARFERLGELRSIELAIQYQSRAIILTPSGHPELRSRFTNLGMSHKSRFEHLGELNDLEDAIKYESCALALTPDGHPEFPSKLANLAVSHKSRFGCVEEPIDLEAAMKYETLALALTPDEHPDASRWQFNYAKTHFEYYRMTLDTSYLQQSLNYFRSASQSFAGAPRDKFRSAKAWAMVASTLSPDDCVEAYQTAIDLLSQFVRLGATTNQRYEDLSTVKTLAVDAAFAAIRLSDYGLALEWLEHARCVVWNQSLMLRSPLDKLKSIYPELGIRLEIVASQLHSAGSESRGSRTHAPGSMMMEQVAQQHRRLAKEYNDLLNQIRQLSGFENFLQPKKARALIHAARSGPVVVINCHEDQCDALLVLPGEDGIKHVALPNFSAQEAQKARQMLESSLRQKGVRERGAKVISLLGQKDNISNSGFFLHDGTLDLTAINLRSFKGKGLAFLSACQTATGDEKLADEAVHLASGMLMAGYTSVIGTMWSVHDEDAPLVADRVYAQLMKDKKVGSGEAGRALHNAVANLRDTVGEEKFERWVPYIHIGS